MTEPLHPGDNIGVRATGVEQRVDASRLERAEARLAEAIRVAELGGSHVWIVLVTHLVDDPARTFRDGEGHLDAESMVSANVGCLRCEEPYGPRLALRRCPGEPRR
jgi:hypothetical protein